jgi:hypothetical protein
MSGADDKYTPAAPEHVLVFPPGTVFTEVATTSEQFFREYCPSTCGYATRFFPHRINAVIHGSRVFFPGTPPSTSSGHTRGISVTSPPDENTPVHGNAINGPGPNDDIGPMSERDPGTENAVNPNFNDDICENVLAVVNMSANTSIYSPPALSSRRSVHLYMPELTRTSCTTHTAFTDGIRTKPMTEILIKTPQDEKSKFPTSISPPTPPYTDKTPADTTYASADMLTTTFPAQPHKTSAFHRPDTKIYGETDMT